jgi:acetyl/propionyl-CoA carboxylase alpha subunit
MLRSLRVTLQTSPAITMHHAAIPSRARVLRGGSRERLSAEFWIAHGSKLSDAVRCDHWIEAGTEVSPYYDPLIREAIVHADTRESAITNLATSLAATRIEGIETNREYLEQILASGHFQRGEVFTAFLRDISLPRARQSKVLDAAP